MRPMRARGIIVKYTPEFNFQGWALGEHLEWAKYSNFRVATNVPLMVHMPGLTDRRDKDLNRIQSAGKASNALVELVDLFPTLADLAGIEIPSKCFFHSLIKLLVFRVHPRLCTDIFFLFNNSRVCEQNEHARASARTRPINPSRRLFPYPRSTILKEKIEGVGTGYAHTTLHQSLALVVQMMDCAIHQKFSG